ncbi:MAG: hypothetical protein U5L45_03255 [Saprospiraceae bacterium]|nr:hypothetical protein [Saprospiraceae bacterium]
MVIYCKYLVTRTLRSRAGVWFIFGLCPKMNHFFSFLRERSECVAK